VSIRVRLATVFTLATAILFALGAWLFVTQLSSGLLRLLDSQLQSDLGQASVITTPIRGHIGALPGQVMLQVFNPQGVLRSSTPDSGDTPLLNQAQLSEARRSTISFTTTIDEESVRVVAGPLAGHAGWVAAAGSPLETFAQTISDVERGLVIAGIVFVIVAACSSYFLARAALAPVEKVRVQVAAMSKEGRGSAIAIPPTHDEVAALATTMNELLQRLEEVLSRQRSFVADASHELRTPFAVLQGELELASRPGRSQEEVSAALGRASEEAARLGKLANDLLLLARSDEARLEVRRQEINVEALLTESAGALRRRAAERNIACRVDASNSLLAFVDPDRMRQALDNLLDNAVRFAPAGSEIELQARAVGDALVVEVRDSGSGFPADYLPHVFERFSRPDSGRARSDGGTGLGLAIVQAIAVAHGGSATARNRPSGGAVVCVQLPGAVTREVPGAVTNGSDTWSAS
jgi:hypothetical protein